MPQLQSLVLTDRTPVTPVNRTFVPRDIADGVGMVVNTASTPIGSDRVSISSKKASTRYKGELRLVCPIVQTETINGVSRPVVVRTAYVTVSTSFDETSTEQERTDAIGMVANALGTSKVLIHDALVLLQGVH